MIVRDAIAEAWSAIAGHRLRALLSSVGIVVGIATVMTAFAIGEGARREAFDEIGALGIDNFYVRAVQPEPSRTRRVPAPLLDLDDARGLLTIQDVAAAAPVRSARTEIQLDGQALDVTLLGAGDDWRRIVDPALASGRWFADDDMRTRRRVAIAGADVSRRIAGSGQAGATHIRVGGEWYDLIGILADRARSGSRQAPVQRVDLNNAVIVPIGAMDLSLGDGDTGDRVDEIVARTSGNVEQAARAAAAWLANRTGAPNAYDVVVPRELLNARLRAQRTFDAVLLAIGSLALFISGIGIMNIMLATVAERTQEIGVRRAFGATRRVVLAQFALEAAGLCAAGGVLGVPAGAVLSIGVAKLAGWPVAISISSVALALVLSSSVGLLFGVYPAKLAASVDPAEALRAP